jgi:hypothetical protein
LHGFEKYSKVHGGHKMKNIIEQDQLNLILLKMEYICLKHSILLGNDITFLIVSITKLLLKFLNIFRNQNMNLRIGFILLKISPWNVKVRIKLRAKKCEPSHRERSGRTLSDVARAALVLSLSLREEKPHSCRRHTQRFGQSPRGNGYLNSDANEKCSVLRERGWIRSNH